MAVSRAALIRGPAIVTWNGATIFSAGDIVPRHAPVWNPVQPRMYGAVDRVRRARGIRSPMGLGGAWENLRVLVPTALLNPTIGASLYGTSDVPLTITARNGDKITYHNAQITRLADLRLGVDENVFAADVEFTAILANNTAPESNAAYYTGATGQTFTESAFAKTNFKRERWTGAWGSKTGWTTVVPQGGFAVAWSLGLAPVTVDGHGTVDMTIQGLVASCRCVPIGPTLAQIEEQMKLAGMAGYGAAHGSLLSSNAADLVLTSSSMAVTLKNAALTRGGYAFGQEPLRNGEVEWTTTRLFTAGVPQAVATVA